MQGKALIRAKISILGLGHDYFHCLLYYHSNCINQVEGRLNMLRLTTNGSARRLARQWLDLKPERRRELLQTLDTESRIAVIENIVMLKVERNRKKGEDTNV